MANYLEQVLNATKAHNSGVARTRANLDTMLSMLQPPAPTGGGVPRVGGVTKSPHSMGDGHGHSSQAEVKGLNAAFNSQLQKLIKDSGGKVSIGSGYRSIAQQTKIYNDWKAGRHPAPRVAKPGRSNHNHGLAADLKFADGKTKKWVQDNAGRYGLVFPMADEPWHIEPVGARKMR